MAIVVSEEGEKKINVGNLVIWFSVLAIIGIAVYFIFFKRPGFVETVSPSNYQNIDPLANVTLNPQEVANDINKLLKEYVPPPSPPIVGRENPFLTP